jgi:hypothetical protein
VIKITDSAGHVFYFPRGMTGFRFGRVWPGEDGSIVVYLGGDRVVITVSSEEYNQVLASVGDGLE